MPEKKWVTLGATHGELLPSLKAVNALLIVGLHRRLVFFFFCCIINTRLSAKVMWEKKTAFSLRLWGGRCMAQDATWSTLSHGLHRQIGLETRIKLKDVYVYVRER